MKVVMRTMAVAVALAAGIGMASAANYPDHPVRVIVPFAAGGPTDVMARLVAQKLSENLKQQFFVENRPGAGGNIGTMAAAHAPADGYTLLVASSSYVVNPSLYAKNPYNAFTDFVPITLAAASPNILVVNASFPAKSVKELVELLKKEPGKYSIANPGIGTTPQLAAELFKLSLKLDAASVPFGGAGPAIQSAVAGHTPIAFTALPPTSPQVQGGALRGLAVTSAKRSAALPDVPTLAEAGFSEQESETMQGVFAPAKTPKEITDLLYKEIAKIMAMPDVKEKCAQLGFDPVANTPDEFAAYIKKEVEKWGRVIRDAKIKQIE
ncbi:tripartite tricarboxylate transporter substrate binding protein [Pseudolabrys taiwanensis]|uniref:Tripartite tricarboxylate transporter substrate binding protein n=2 Tax=Pseudolabrys taiwanensis TaxID=331696 RepID=A0A346A101_9HYPH|nr:tripartite tricarboxylate transporter substrate binding protein [Pseudolabrys taiwanensis]